MESRHPYLCVINKTLRNPISFEIPSTGVLLSRSRPPTLRHSSGRRSHEARRNVSCTFYQLVPSITTLLDFKKLRKVRRECEKSSVVSFFVFSNFIRYFIWHSTNTLLNSRRRERSCDGRREVWLKSILRVTYFAMFSVFGSKLFFRNSSPATCRSDNRV